MLEKLSVIWRRIILQIGIWKIRRGWTKRISRQIEKMTAEATNPNSASGLMTSYECMHKTEPEWDDESPEKAPCHPHKKRNQRTAPGTWKKPLSPYLSAITRAPLSPTCPLIHGGLLHSRKGEIIEVLSFFPLTPSFGFLS